LGEHHQRFHFTLALTVSNSPGKSVVLEAREPQATVLGKAASQPINGGGDVALFREYAPRGASNQKLGTRALYSGVLPLSRLICFCNGFTVLKKAMLAQKDAKSNR
jgi:hypothetical protein